MNDNDEDGEVWCDDWNGIFYTNRPVSFMNTVTTLKISVSTSESLEPKIKSCVSSFVDCLVFIFSKWWYLTGKIKASEFNIVVRAAV